MIDGLTLLWAALTGLFRSRARLEAEILVLRQQINVLQRKSGKRFPFSHFDRLVFTGLYRLVPGILDALAIVRLETVIGWWTACNEWSGCYFSSKRHVMPSWPGGEA